MAESPPGILPLMEFTPNKGLLPAVCVEYGTWQPPPEPADTRPFPVMNTETTATSDSVLANPEAEGRLKDLSRVVRGLVHDIRNPLNVIRTNLYLLRQKLPGENPGTTKSLNRIDDQVSAILRILDGVSAHYRADEPALQRIDLNEVTRALVEGFPLPEEIAPVLQLAAEPATVRADVGLIQAALRALLQNAVKAMGGRGQLRVATTRTDHRLQLIVEDTGTGIPAGVQEHVFEPFFTTWDGHAGLGLALVRKVARAHEGRAWIESRPGEGTRVTLELPATSA